MAIQSRDLRRSAPVSGQQPGDFPGETSDRTAAGAAKVVRVTLARSEVPYTLHMIPQKDRTGYLSLAVVIARQKLYP